MRDQLLGFNLSHSRWRLMGQLIIVVSSCAGTLMGCAPEGSRIKDSAPNTGVYEKHFIAFTLPEVKVGNEIKKPRTNHCIAIGTFSNSDTNEYNCNFFEFSNPGTGIVATTKEQAQVGLAGRCLFEGNPNARSLTCLYRNKFACSAYNDALRGKDEKVAPLVIVQNETKPFQATAAPAQGTSTLGVSYPIAEGIAIGEGDCTNANNQFLSGASPAGSQAAGKKVTFALKASAPANSAIKTSSAQSSSLAEGTTKCTIIKPSTGTVTVTAESLTSPPSATEKHFIVSKLISVSDGSKELCPGFLPNATGSVYLFGDHWTQTAK